MSDKFYVIREARVRLQRTLSHAVSQPYLTAACQLTLQEVQKSLRDLSTLLTPLEYHARRRNPKRDTIPLHESLSSEISSARELKRQATWFVEIVKGWIPPEVPSILAAWQIGIEADTLPGSDGPLEGVGHNKNHNGSMMGWAPNWNVDFGGNEYSSTNLTEYNFNSPLKKSPTMTSFESIPSLANSISTLTSDASTIRPSAHQQAASQAEMAALFALQLRMHEGNHNDSHGGANPMFPTVDADSISPMGLTKRHLENQLPHQPHHAHEAKHAMLFWYLRDIPSENLSLSHLLQNPPPTPQSRPPPEPQPTKPPNRKKIQSRVRLEVDVDIDIDIRSEADHYSRNHDLEVRSNFLPDDDDDHDYQHDSHSEMSGYSGVLSNVPRMRGRTGAASVSVASMSRYSGYQRSSSGIDEVLSSAGGAGERTSSRRYRSISGGGSVYSSNNSKHYYSGEANESNYGFRASMAEASYVS